MKKKREWIFPRGKIHKLNLSLKKMKLTVILTMLVLATFGNGFSQVKVTLKFEKAKIEQVFETLEDQTDFIFLYKDEIFDQNKRYSVNFDNVPFQDVLKSVCENSNVDYEVRANGQIILTEKVDEPLFKIAIQQKAITGVVYDEDGRPLPGVSVVVKGTTMGTVTNADGEFSLTIPASAEALQFSFVGMKTQEIAIGDKIVFSVVMEQETFGIEEVVAIGYGTVRKSDLTGAVSSVQAEELQKGMYTSVNERLQGKSSGVVISQVSGKPGSEMKVRIRGINSIASGNDPLYVIDGVPKQSTINPDDIETIQILKGPSATAIYGSRASNGVIIITTKEGQKGKLTVNYNTKVGISTPSKKVDVLNGEEYMLAMNELDIARGASPEFSQEEINAIGEGTDWQDEIFRTAFREDHTLSFSGGDESGTYLVSLNYLDEEGVIKSSDYTRYVARINLRRNTEKFSFGINMNGVHRKRTLMKSEGITNQEAGVTNGSLEFSPVIPAEKNEEGYYPLDPYVSLANPLNILEGHYNKDIYNEIAANIFGEYDITSDLSVKALISGEVNNSSADLYQSRMTYMGRGQNGIADVDDFNNQYYLGQITATYKKSFDAHRLEVLAGSTYENFQHKSLNTHISDFPTDLVKTYNLGMGNDDLDGLGSGFSENSLLSYLGRINYSFADKYLFTFSYRVDGSSRFGKNNKFAYFPSGSFAWRLGEEEFISQYESISNLKLRISYGLTGNQAIGNYKSLSTFQSSGAASLNNEPKTTMVQARIPNPDLKWESTSQFDVGLNIGFFEGRLSGDFDYFRKLTTDMLYNVPVPSSSGFSSFLDNIGEMENKGIEITLRTANIVGNDFTWNTSLNFSYIKNTVLDLGPVSEIVHGSLGHTPSVAIIREGETMESYYGHEVIGIWQEGEDPSNSAQPFAEPGYPKFKDQNNDGELNDKDLVILGDPFPEYTFGMTNYLTYKDLSLSFFIRGVEGRDLLDNDVVTSITPISEGRNRLAETWKNRWTPSNPDAEFPSHIEPYKYMGSQINSYTVRDASFIRLSNVVLEYNIPVESINFLKEAHISFAVNNVFTLTDWIGYNPEMNWHGGSNLEGSYNAYPLSRTYSFGINVQF